MTTPRNADEYFRRLSTLLELEAEAEKLEAIQETQRRPPPAAESSGYSLTGLVIREEDVGLGGRILLTLAKRNQTQALPWTRLGGGTPIILTEQAAGSASEGWRGLVTRLSRDAIQIALAGWPETESEHALFRLDRSSDEISRQRQRQALERAAAAHATRLADLREVLLGNRPAGFQSLPELTPLDPALNASQREAVRFALSADDVAIIHGPPGTGKTTTLVELIRQIVSTGQRVLAVAPSNIAVDNLLERLLNAGETPIRLGHPARVAPELREHTLDLLVEAHPDARLAQKLTRDAYTLRGRASRYTRAKPEPGARQAMRREAKDMLADARKIEDQLIERLLDGARIVCATSTGLERGLLGSRAFDWCIMDEASQATEANAWTPLQYAQRIVLAGDPCQLPPTIVSAEAAARGFNVSLMERLLDEIGTGISRRLDVQYRMHRDIMEFSSREFYGASLQADPSVQTHLLQDLPGVTPGPVTGTPVDFIDTAGAGYDESVEVDGDSRFNLQEAGIALQRLQVLLEAGLAPQDIAVISPYSAQVRLLRERLAGQSEIEVDSVDGFQGREKEAVIVSLVRSNADGAIGFLEDVRRTNVAMTRARRKLIVIGDSATIAAHPFYQRLVAYFESIGAYHSVWE